jgi:hypothetical protein
MVTHHESVRAVKVKLRTRVDELDRLIGQQNDARTSLAETQKALDETPSEQRKI